MSQLLRNIIQARAGSNVERCHGIVHVGSYSNAKHQWGVCALLFQLFPEHFQRLAAHALFHDTAEAWIGDIPAPTLRYCLSVRKETHALESQICAQIGLPREDELLGEDLEIVKSCDRLELYIWCLEQRATGSLYAEECRKELEVYLDTLSLPGRAQELYNELRLLDERAVVPVQSGVVRKAVEAAAHSAPPPDGCPF